MAHERNVSNSSGGNDTKSNYVALRARLALDIKIKGRLKVDYAAVSSIYELAGSATRRCAPDMNGARAQHEYVQVTRQQRY